MGQRLGTPISGNLINCFGYVAPITVSQLNGGTGASSSTFWRGDGTWVAPVTSIDTATGAITISGLLSRSSQDLRVTAATQSDQETATSTAVAVTPGRQHFHPLSPKAWATFVGSSGSVVASSGVTSVSRGGAGTYTVTFSTAFSSAVNYGALGSTEHNLANSIVKFGSGANKTTTTIAVFAINLATNGLVDPDYVTVMFFGDQ
jgi:hypothetical protein